ncbi:MAG: ferritin-like domain-containing protein, partial [Candidatus Eremiobacteraeota bacterium]|nr:ferritin-like domain-containing protein [Candidatus Eremiobacteraeota bacterium]
VDPSRITQASQAAAPSAVGAAAAGATITLNFADPNDYGVLNYAYALEQLEAAFYQKVVTAAQYTSIFPIAEQRIFNDLRDHEAIHRDFLRAALGSDAIPNLTPQFGSIDFNSRASVLSAAQTFEDTGVGAYNGAARYIKNSAYLTIAGKIVSVEARHASAIRDLQQPRSGNFAPNTFDPASKPTDVAMAVKPFLAETITIINS